MTVVAFRLPLEVEGTSSQLCPCSNGRMQAGATAQQGQAVFYDVSGNVALNDGTVPGLLCGGWVWPTALTESSSAAGVGRTFLYEGMGTGISSSTVSGDSFAASDVLAVAWDAGNGVPGKKSNASGNNRSIMGLVLGLLDGSPRLYVGRVASLLARALLTVNAYPLARFGISDAAASTTTAERTVQRPKVHGTVTDVTFTGAAVAADNTDYVTVTIAKRDGAGGGATTIATYDSRAANQGAVTAFVPASFALVAGTLNLLETDVVTITVAKAGAGKTLTGEILVNGKAI